ncbi:MULTISPECIES: hypothetical protein [unclassified Leuconostoc]|uniref:hypothetical protein n=1 Tax=unclassified Leuconostoc TaxID=2685106 RepID=UPI001903DF8B|nr:MULTISPECIES: hypothetical protein [unclassified Leuconostoc]MBK0040764.1 hypothetical protein [Leuconostoc sp. S51]MBK0051814.1 hypothetical protein [Leuconostoc sp. S50]
MTLKKVQNDEETKIILKHRWVFPLVGGALLIFTLTGANYMLQTNQTLNANMKKVDTLQQNQIKLYYQYNDTQAQPINELPDPKSYQSALDQFVKHVISDLNANQITGTSLSNKAVEQLLFDQMSSYDFQYEKPSWLFTKDDIQWSVSLDGIAKGYGTINYQTGSKSQSINVYVEMNQQHGKVTVTRLQIGSFKPINQGCQS